MRRDRWGWEQRGFTFCLHLRSSSTLNLHSSTIMESDASVIYLLTSWGKPLSLFLVCSFHWLCTVPPVLSHLKTNKLSKVIPANCHLHLRHPHHVYSHRHHIHLFAYVWELHPWVLSCILPTVFTAIKISYNQMIRKSDIDNSSSFWRNYWNENRIMR